jgi:hypothetical protein
MKLPELLPTRPIMSAPYYGSYNASGQIEAAQFDFLNPKNIVCAAKCGPKAGYAACLARCLLDGQACDGGINNCS